MTPSNAAQQKTGEVCPGHSQNQHPKSSPFSTEASSQRARILAASKRQGGIASMEPRHELNIIDPPKRVSELVANGHRFLVIYEPQPDHAGRRHSKCARYIWLSSPDDGADGLSGVRSHGTQPL